MSKQAKKIVRDFLESDVFINPSLLKDFLSVDFMMNWHASSGFKKFDFDDYQRLCQMTASSYVNLRSDISHIFSDKNEVAVRFTIYVKTIENPIEEMPIGYFISIFEVSEDDKIKRIYQTSHPKE